MKTRMKTRIKLKLFPTQGKIKSDCFISHDKNHYKVSKVFDTTILTYCGKRLKLSKCSLLKVFIMRKHKILGELSYLNYKDLDYELKSLIFNCKKKEFSIINKWNLEDFKVNDIYNRVSIGDEIKVISFNSTLDLAGLKTTLTNIVNRKFIIISNGIEYPLRRYNFKPLNRENKKGVYIYDKKT